MKNASMVREGMAAHRQKAADAEQRSLGCTRQRCGGACPCIKRAAGSADKCEREKLCLIGFIRDEIRVIKDRDPAIKSTVEALLYPSLHAMIHHRIANHLYKKGYFFVARWVSQFSLKRTGIEIHPGATIGKGLFIDHGSGVVIGETTIIGDNVTLYQGVTLGGTGKEKGKRHPTIEDNVMISAGARVLGSFTVGRNSKIGAGAVVLREVPPNSTVVGVPGRVVKRDNVRVPSDELDQVHMPDPVMNDITKLRQENAELRKAIGYINKELDAIRRNR